MSDGSNNSTSLISEHEVTRVMAGTVESVRHRLVPALEQLGFRVLSENPLRARHGARGGANYFMSANALDFPTHVEISLKPQGPGATQIIFDYRVQHGAFGKGDRQTLTREAESMIALALQRTEVRHCPGCKLEVAADSRFCRKCGTPVVINAPAELEVMRLTAGARAGYQWTWIGVVILLISWLFPIFFLLRGLPLNKFAIVWAIISAVGVWALGAGLRRTHLTINPQTEEEKMRLPMSSPAGFAVLVTDELPSQPEYHSITDGTTNLLPDLPESEAARREKIPSQG